MKDSIEYENELSQKLGLVSEGYATDCCTNELINGFSFILTIPTQDFMVDPSIQIRNICYEDGKIIIHGVCNAYYPIAVHKIKMVKEKYPEIDITDIARTDKDKIV